MRLSLFLLLGLGLSCSRSPTMPIAEKSDRQGAAVESENAERPTKDEDQDDAQSPDTDNNASRPDKPEMGQDDREDEETSQPSTPEKPSEDKPIDETTAPPTTTPELVWKKANLTHYESYPDPGSEECLEYNGCTWAGMFAALDGKQSEEWVKANNIIAVHSKDFKTYKLKTLRLKKGSKTIDAKVYDMCADSDCNGCCTKNAKETGFLIDIEKYTKQRFSNIGDGVIEWTCVDCK